MKLILIMSLITFSYAFASIKISTFNIRNFNQSSTDKKLLKSTIEKLDADILVVQEIVDGNGLENFLRTNFSELKLSLSRCGGGGNQKLGFVYNSQKIELINFETDSRFENSVNSSCGSLRPAVIGTFRRIKNREQFTVVGLHLKAGDGSRNFFRRWQQYNLMADLYEELQAKWESNIIFAGDLNSTGYILKNSDFKKFADMLDQVEGVSTAESVKCTSYWSGTNRNDGIEEPSILDHIIVTGSLKSRLKEVTLGSHCQKIQCKRAQSSDLGQTYKSLSDHCPVGIEIE